MISHIRNFLLFKDFRKFNLDRLKKINQKNINRKDVVLLEFNSFNIIHIIFSYFSIYFKKKNYHIVSFYSHILMTYNLLPNLKQRFFRTISPLLNLGFFGVYKSFGVNKFIFPKINKSIVFKSDKKFKEIYESIKSKNDILSININNIYLGDLIYDTYLTRNGNQKPTIDFKENDFKDFLLDFIKLFYFWIDYFEKNSVKAILSTHGCYTMGIPVRIALNKDILSLEVKENRLKRLTKKNLFYSCEAENYPHMFKKLPPERHTKALYSAEKRMEERFKGSNEDLPYVTRSAFSEKNVILSKIKQNDKVKILILPHDFIDAPHSGGLFPFPDMFEWMKFLANMSKKTKKYDWYLKTHPRMGEKWEWYQEFTRINVSKIIQDSNIVTLDPNTTHNEIIKSGINVVLTIFGTAAHEYAYKNIKVINGGDTNPHFSYNFNRHVSNYDEYEKLFTNLEDLEFEIDKKKVLEFYYVHYIYCDKNWFFDYDHLLKKLNNYHLQWTEKIYDYWILNSEKKENFEKSFQIKIENFIKSKDLVFTLDHNKNI